MARKRWTHVRIKVIDEGVQVIGIAQSRRGTRFFDGVGVLPSPKSSPAEFERGLRGMFQEAQPPV